MNQGGKRALMHAEGINCVTSLPQLCVHLKNQTI